MKTPVIAAISALSLTVSSFGVDPPPDGGYPNNNTAEGEDALFNVTTAFNNTAVGFNSLFANTIGGDNTAVGAFALVRNTSGANNTATGDASLFNNTTGKGNTANGVNALGRNTGGNFNTANGIDALFSNTTGGNNVAAGKSALFNNSVGKSNLANGVNALANNTTGSFNIGLGDQAGSALTTGSNNIDIANGGVAGESRTIRIGKQGTQSATYIAGISGATVAGGVAVIIDTSGHLGTVTSSKRYKERIQPMKDASEAILSLEPVTFRYKKDLDPDAILQFGLVAEDVAKVDPDLVARDEEGKPYTVRYEAVNAMLLNEFLKEHKKAEEQAKKVDEQASEIADLKTALKDVNARLTARGL